METTPQYQTSRDSEKLDQLLQDGNLSYRAIGLAVYLLSLTDGEFVSMDQLDRAHTEGKVSIRNALKELAQGGYLMRERVYGKGWSGLKVRTNISTKPIYLDRGTVKERLNGHVVHENGDGS